MRRAKSGSRVRRAFRGRSRGFSLIEVVIAIALIGIIGVAILSALSYASMVLIMNKGRATAESLARTQMEYVKNQEYDDTEPQSYEQTDVESPDHPGYFISVSAQPLHNPDDGIQEITVTVRYYIVSPNPANRMAEKTYTLVDYKRNPET
jgi:prepilin-type N-terminal cleavage/methylation domain-containing protein